MLRIRDRLFDRYRDSWVTYLITCSFCTAFYIAGTVALLTDIVVGLTAPVLVWLAAAAVAGTLIEVVDALRAIVMRST